MGKPTPETTLFPRPQCRNECLHMAKLGVEGSELNRYSTMYNQAFFFSLPAEHLLWRDDVLPLISGSLISEGIYYRMLILSLISKQKVICLLIFIP